MPTAVELVELVGLFSVLPALWVAIFVGSPDAGAGTEGKSADGRVGIEAAGGDKGTDGQERSVLSFVVVASAVAVAAKIIKANRKRRPFISIYSI